MTWLLLCAACVAIFVFVWAAAVLNGRTCGLREDPTQTRRNQQTNIHQ